MTSTMQTRRTTKRTLEGDRLTATVNAVQERYDPDQIILFGSAARGEMTEHSDIDLLLIRDDGFDKRMRRDRIELNGDQIDVIQMTLSDVERHRRTAARLQEAALREGITVLVKNNGRAAVPTGESCFTDESGMVKTTKLKPDESPRFLRRAINKWNGSNSTDNDDETRCYLRHQTIEQCLKGLITAQGLRFRHIHELDTLWTTAESEGELIPARRNDTMLKRLGEYAGDGRYGAEDPEADQRMLAESRELVEAVLVHSQEAIPRLTRNTNAVLAKTPQLRKPTAEMTNQAPPPAVQRPSAMAATARKPAQRRKPGPEKGRKPPGRS